MTWFLASAAAFVEPCGEGEFMVVGEGQINVEDDVRSRSVCCWVIVY